MKKTIMVIAIAFGITSAFAQDSTSTSGLISKKGEPILPESGDWAISFDAVPFMNYLGNLFSGATTTNGSPGATWVNPGTMTITGKLFKDEKTAYRATVRLGFNSGSTTALIADASQTVTPTYPNPATMKEDKWSGSSRFIGLGGGIEMRRGKTRLQGFYGGEAMIWMSGKTNTFDYGNAVSSTIPVNNATSTNFGIGATSTGSNITVDPTYGVAARVLKDKVGTTFGFGVRGFIGAEYFIFPKIAVGAEYGWGLGISMTGQGTRELESVGGSPATPGTIEYKTNKSGNFGVDTDINGGTGSGTTQLKITLHF